MRTFNVTAASKNKNSIRKFVRFFNVTMRRVKLKTKKKFFIKKERKKFMTILTSPHVNKSAQEQFEIRTFSVQLRIETMQSFKFLVLVKRIGNQLFPDTRIKLSLGLNQVKQDSLKKKLFNLDNFRVRKLKPTDNQNTGLEKIGFPSSTNFTRLFDIYGA